MKAEIIREIETEIDYAEGKWSTEFDDKNTLNDWITYINIYLGRAAEIGIKDDKAAQRKFFIKAAGLAISALRTFDRNGGFAPRHYDTRS